MYQQQQQAGTDKQTRGPGYIQAEGDTKQAKRMLQDDMKEARLMSHFFAGFSGGSSKSAWKQPYMLRREPRPLCTSISKGRTGYDSPSIER